jgi:hypothetical protein
LKPFLAKKLKKEWVAKQKIKSKWKAQKRRDCIVTQRDEISQDRDKEGQHTRQSLVQPQEAQGGAPSLRELQRQAYSPASLHHFKSRPLHRSNNRTATHKADISGNNTRGGGQPDMRKRMSAMLEKIKRDYS